MPHLHDEIRPAQPCAIDARTRLALALGLSLGLAAAGANAADAAATPPAADVRTAGLQVTPSASVTETWDDNIYGTSTGERNDTITSVEASIKAASNWTRHRLGLDAGVTADYYNDHDSEDVVDWWAGADGRYDLSAKSHALGGLLISKDHEDRASPDSASSATEPTTYQTTRAHLGFAHALAPFTIRLGAVFEQLDFDQGSSPTFDVDQRDRRQYSIGTRFSYQLTPHREIFFQAATDTREYNDNTTGRDSEGYRLGLGVRLIQSTQFEAEGFAGHLTQDYDNVALKDVSALYFGANLKWKPTATTRLTAGLDRAVNETTFVDASSVAASSHLDTTLSGSLEHDLTDRLSLNARLSYSNSDYQGVSLELDEYAAAIGARFYFSKNLFLSGGYRHISRDATIASFEYDRNLFFVSAGFAQRKR